MNEMQEKTENCCHNGTEKDTAPEQKAKDDKGLGMGVIFFLVGFAVCFLSGWLLFPKLLYSQKEQPFNFDHRLHTYELGGCDSCHYLREDGTFNGIPKLDSCLDCHDDVPLGDTEAELIFCEEYVAKEKEIPWLVYSRQPDCVFFSHAAHSHGKNPMDCTECHGDIGDSEVLKPYEENRITGYSRDIWGKSIWGIKKNSWDSMKMDDCAKCHKAQTGSQGACFQCHK